MYSLFLLFLPLTLSCKVLSLSGGGALGAFEAGVFSSIIQQQQGQWDLITGVSAGSINALYLSSIEPQDEIKFIPLYESLWSSLKNSDIYSPSLFLNGQSVLSTNPLRNTLNKYFHNRKSIRPFLISATSLSQGINILFNNK